MTTQLQRTKLMKVLCYYCYRYMSTNVTRNITIRIWTLYVMITLLHLLFIFSCWQSSNLIITGLTVWKRRQLHRGCFLMETLCQMSQDCGQHATPKALTRNVYVSRDSITYSMQTGVALSVRFDQYRRICYQQKANC